MNIMTVQSLINNEYLLTIIDMHIYLVDEKNTYRRGKLPEVCSFDIEFFSLN